MFNKKKITQFTLVEVLISLIIITMAMTTVVSLASTNIQQSQLNQTEQTSTLLINAIKEKTASMSIAEIDAWIGGTTLELSKNKNKGPIRGDGEQYKNYDKYSQFIQSQYLDPTDLTKTTMTPSNNLEITITIRQSGTKIKEASWVVFE